MTELKKNLADSQVRQEVVSDLNSNILLEAAAGSGKTSCLVSRIVALLKTGHCKVEELVAITFTRKAAAELRQRVQLAIEEELSKEHLNKEEKTLLSLALGQIDRAFLGTIHSFAAYLLRQQPLAAAVDPDFIELDETENIEEGLKFFWSEMERLSANNDSQLKKIVAEGIKPDWLENIFLHLVTYSDVIVQEKLQTKPNFQQFFDKYKKFVERQYQQVVNNTNLEQLDQLAARIKQVYFRFQRGILNNEEKIFSTALLLNSSALKVVKKSWHDPELPRRLQSELKTFQGEILNPFINNFLSYRYPLIINLLLPAVENFQRQRLAEGRLNFQDLLSCAAKMLRDNHFARNYFAGQIKVLLVDEFQDVDPLQVEIVFYLMAREESSGNWWQFKLRPASLFIVGDPKQSIYRFRRADIDIYNRVKQIFNEQGKILALSTNFRATAQLVEFVNQTFVEKFPAKATNYQPAYQQFVACEKNTSAQLSGVKKINLERVKRHKKELIASQDAKKIAKIINRLLTSGDYLPEDFLILLRKKKYLHLYARELDRLAIANLVSGEKLESINSEIEELLKIIRLLAEPANQVLLLRVLRGHFFSISDQQLYQYRKNGQQLSLLSAPEGESQTALALKKLRHFCHLSRKEALDYTLQQIVEESGLLSQTLARQKSDNDLAQIYWLLEIAREEELKGTLFSEFSERLTKELAKDREELSLYPFRQESVRIMNLHKAKGLESRVVFLAAPFPRTAKIPSQHICREENKSAAYFTISNNQGYGRRVIARPKNWPAIEALEKEYADAENIRLIYVAATRAKELLVISDYPDSKKESDWQFLNENLQEVAELVVDPLKEKEKEKLNKKVVTVSWQEADFSKIAEASYYKTTVSQVYAEKTDYQLLDKSGRGKSFGRVVHRCLEAVANGLKTEQLANYAGNLLIAEERDPQEVTAVVQLLNNFFKSDLWQRIRASERCLTEVSLPFKEEHQQKGKLIYGTADIIFKEAKGWVVVDYKTGNLPTDLEEELNNRYKQQLELYGTAFQRLSGEVVKEKIIYYLNSCQEVNF